jgi:RHS repeat-associated protein
VTGTNFQKNWGETFTVDPWGNLTSRTVTKCVADGLSLAVLNNNRLMGFGYDAAGNMTSNGSASYSYNGEGQLTATAGVTYTYDGDGNRVEKSNGTLYWGSGPLSESDLSGNLLREFIYAGVIRVARRDLPDGTVHYFFTDYLGSVHVQTTASGTIQNDSDFYPYGGERVYKVVTINQNYKFEGHERDKESGLDNFGARYDSSALGRFMTPDWAAKPTAVPYAKFGDPQTLNLYAFVENAPVNKADADGHGDYYSSNGTKLGSDGFKDGNVYIAPAGVTKMSDGKVNVAKTFTSVTISASVGGAIQASVSRTMAKSGGDTKGGFHEEGFTVDNKNGIHPAKAGPAYKPGDHEAHVNQTITPNTTIEEHTHPAGTQDAAGSISFGGTKFGPKPSTQDENNAGSTPGLGQNILHIEASADTHTVYFYDDQGVYAQVPLGAFPEEKH